MDSLVSRDILEPRVSPVSAFLDPQVYLEYLELKVSLAQKETLASQVAPVHLDDLDSMAPRDLKVTPVHLAHLELVVPPESPPAAQWGSQAAPDLLAQWDHLDSLDQMERRETPALQV